MSAKAAWARLAVLALAVLALDQLTKAVVVGSIEQGERSEVLPFLDFVHVRNEGVAFGLLDGAGQALVMTVTLIAIGLVGAWFAVKPTRPGAWLAIGFLAGGAIGNLIDRFARDAVVDFLDLPAWPSFNVADIAITAGVVLLVLAMLKEPRAGE
ncbi:MAG: signal peptidase II [Actinomycetota bacterium]|nr:signal peptidase II [Actinomycetota bacterium]